MKFWFTLTAGVLVVTVVSTCMFVWNPELQAPPPIEVDSQSSAATEGEFPKLVVESTEASRDKVPQYHQGTTVFQLRNEGMIPLELERGRTSCTCAGATLRKKGETTEDEQTTITLAPGEQGEFVVTWDSKNRVGKFVVSAILNSNDPLKQEVTFRINLDVKVNVLASDDFVNFGRVREGESKSEAVVVYSEILDDLEILEASTTSDMLTTKIKPVSKERLEKLNALSGAVVEVTISDGYPVGNFAHRLQVKTNVEDADLRAINIAGSVFGSVEVVPSRVDFKVISGNKSHQKQVKIFAHNLTEEDELVAGDVEPKFLKAKVTRDAEFPTLWRLEVTVPEQAPVGAFEGTISVNDGKGKPKVNVLVKGAVVKAAETVSAK